MILFDTVVAFDYRNPWTDRSEGRRAHQLMVADLLAGRTVWSYWCRGDDVGEVRRWLERFMDELRPSGQLQAVQLEADGTQTRVFPGGTSAQAPDVTARLYARAHAPAIGNLPVIRWLGSHGVPFVYDISDYWQGFPRSWGRDFDDASVAEYESRADAFTLVSPVFAGELPPDKPRQVIPNGVSELFLRSDRQKEGSADASPTAIYAGSMAPWRFDWDLLDRVSDLLPEWWFRLLGSEGSVFGVTSSEFAAEVDLAHRVMSKPNVGRPVFVPHPELPSVLEASTAAILPYKLNRSTLSISPLKVMETIGIGLPTVSTELPQLRDLPLVSFAGSAPRFAEALRGVSRDEEGNVEQFRASRDYALAMTWATRSAEMTTFVQSVRAVRGSPGPADRP